MSAATLLVVAVAAVGVLHTLVPDHWAPIALLSRQQGWSRGETVRAAAIAGCGHTLSTLAIALVVWAAGAVAAAHFGRTVALLSDAALIGFGAWIALSSLRELGREAAGHEHDHGHVHFGHFHEHRHGVSVHAHWHEHHAHDWHAIEGNLALASPPQVEEHQHAHVTSARTALLLIIGSSPMIEGIPAFFAATRYGVGELVLMSFVFGAATISTYVGLVVASTAGLKRLDLGPLERYGEVLSGGFIALLGIVFLIWPTM